jgi:hypothetical protein
LGFGFFGFGAGAVVSCCAKTGAWRAVTAVSATPTAKALASVRATDLPGVAGVFAIEAAGRLAGLWLADAVQ